MFLKNFKLSQPQLSFTIIFIQNQDMSNLILFDDDQWHYLLPLTYTRPTCDLRAGILTVREKWEKYLGQTSTTITQDYLSEKYPLILTEDNLLINGGLLPNPQLVSMIQTLELNEALLEGDILLAARLGKSQFDRLTNGEPLQEMVGIDLAEHPNIYSRLQKPYDLFMLARQELLLDYKLLTTGRVSAPISPTNQVINPENIFLEEGVTMEYATLNASELPIYLGKGSEVMEGSLIRGGLALGEHSTIKMGAKLYGPNIIGPHCKVGGEVGNSVLQGYSNKGHEGYLGNSVLGEWCNLGADTNTSNLKNNYAEIKLWSYPEERFVASGLQFCGLIMGDHSKAGINTMFNTGTVVGVSANIYGEGYPRNFVPSFSWGGKQGMITYQINKALEVADTVMKRRKLELTEIDARILHAIFLQSSSYRNWEKSSDKQH